MNKISIELESWELRGGETVTGTVVLKLDRATPIRGIRVQLQGYECASWTVAGKGGNSYEEKRVLVNEEQTLHGQPPLGPGGLLVDSIEGFFKKDSYEELPAGEHRYPFACELPANIPGTYESEITHSRISYSLKAQADLPLKKDLREETWLEVIEPDATEEPQPVSARQTKRFLFDRNTSAELAVHLDKDVYVAGEQVCCRLEVTNRAPGKELRAVRVVVNQDEQARAGSQSCNKGKEVVRAEFRPKEFPLSKTTTAELKFDLPGDLPPTTTLGNIVKLTYEVQATLEIPWAKDLSITIPIRLLARKPRPKKAHEDLRARHVHRRRPSSEIDRGAGWVDAGQQISQDDSTG